MFMTAYYAINIANCICISHIAKKLNLWLNVGQTIVKVEEGLMNAE